MPSEWKDERLIIRALREGWRIPADKLAALVDRVLSIATDPKSSDRTVVAAVRALVSAQRLQLTAMLAEMKIEEHCELAQKLQELQEKIEGMDGGGWHGSKPPGEREARAYEAGASSERARRADPPGYSTPAT